MVCSATGTTDGSRLTLPCASPIDDSDLLFMPAGCETDVLRLGALLEGARPWAQHQPPL
jgi:hypothetical protein